MRVCVQNVDMTVRYNAHSHSFSDTDADPMTATPLRRTVISISLNFVALQTRLSRLTQFLNSKTEWKEHFF